MAVRQAWAAWTDLVTAGSAPKGLERLSYTHLVCCLLPYTTYNDEYKRFQCFTPANDKGQPTSPALALENSDLHHYLTGQAISSRQLEKISRPCHSVLPVKIPVLALALSNPLDLTWPLAHSIPLSHCQSLSPACLSISPFWTCHSPPFPFAALSSHTLTVASFALSLALSSQQEHSWF
ncbi:hypothetical protein AURDEDRAFT_178024 [Auricularia subglabra TFB-10046 SS5]|uniref:Uncharacterized protein n=1 Tax=Auricularia subglabra (strain TFB-10046 / SS5) TaxID=717982 RepID=J0D2M7_AURST|nr:hypothetical protein AURDEDRAFT_178024 [Auricularia subglabra TFB-10046 SS5]